MAELRSRLSDPMQLLSRDITVSDRGKQVDLIDDLLKYKTIEIRYTFNAYGNYVQSMRMPVLTRYGWSNSDGVLNALIDPINGWQINFVFGPNSIKIDNSTTDANWAIKGIYGWMY